VLIKQIDALDLEPFERAFHGLLDVFGPTIQTCRSRAIVAPTQIEPELVAITTLLWKGASASPTSSSLMNGP